MGCGSQWKTYLNSETGAWHCKRCDAGGVDHDIQVPMRRILDRLTPVARQEWPEVQLPEYEPLTKMARRYLAKRGITEPQRQGIVSLKGGTRVLIPYHGRYGRVIYWTTRSFIPDGNPKYVAAPGRHPLYMLPDYAATEKEVTVVEGVFDAIVLHLHSGEPVIALGGKSLPNYLCDDINSLCLGRKRVMLDHDAVKYAFRVAKKIGGYVYLLPEGEDPASYYGKELLKDGD